MADILSNSDRLTEAMKEHIAVLENIMHQDRVMRHDRRHFETLLQTLLQEGNIEEALKCLNERLSQEPHGVKKYCEIPHLMQQ